MTKVQPGYAWLWHDEKGPKELLEALALVGTYEVAGKANSPVIMGWAKETNTTYPGDDVAWCGLFKSVVAKRAGWDYHPNGNALWARNWASWGNGVELPMLGDTLVFSRGGGGHVALYVGEDDTHWHILGGNQSDQVNIVRKAKRPASQDGGLIAARRAPWKVAQPDNVRRIILKNTGAPLAGSEA